MGKNKHLTALKSNSNTVWFNFQTCIYIYIYMKSLKMLKRVILRKTDNTMTERKQKKRQTIINKTLYRKLKIEH